MNYIKLSFFWLLAIFIVNPIGEFPLNDDWAYTIDVAFYIKNGFFKFVDWSSMTLVSQLYIAIIASKFFGLSFTLLRILTLINGLIGVLISYKIILNISSNTKIALLCSSLIAANPIYFCLSNTFMTDVYFFTFSAATILFFERYINTKKKYYLIFAILFSIISTMSRQIGLILPFAFLITNILLDKKIILKSFILNFSPFLLTLISLLVFNNWFNSTQEISSNYVSFSTIINSINLTIFERAFYRIGTSIMSISLFVSPLLLFIIPEFKRIIQLKKNRIVLFVTLLFLIPLLRAWTNLPIDNILYNFGAGPKLLRDAEILKINSGFTLDEIPLSFIKIIALLSSLILIYFVIYLSINVLKNKSCNLTLISKKTYTISLVYGIFLFISFTIPLFFFDRYLLQLLLPLMILLTTIKIDNNLFLKYSFLAIIIFTAFSIGLTHDYLSWNKARWKGLNYLTNEMKISPKEIDGGFEFNAYYQTAEIANSPDKSWWFVNNDKYLISFGELPNYKVIKTIKFTQYIPYKTNNIYVLEKINNEI